MSKMSELEKFASSSLRGPRRGIYQNLLADLLFQATRTNDPLIKISKTCEAAMASTQKDKINMELLDLIYTVCSSFLNTEVKATEKMVSVTWAFKETEEDWKKYVDPWNKIGLAYYPIATRYAEKHRLWIYSSGYESSSERQETERNLRYEINQILQKLPPHEFFFEKTGALAKDSFFSLKAEFCRWALNQLMPIQAKIAEEIEPDIWKEAAGFISPEQRSEAKEQDGDQMGPRQ